MFSECQELILTTGVRERENLPKGPARNERLQFLSEAAIEMRYFKDGWRNYVSHGRGAYDEHNARGIIEHVRAFMTPAKFRHRWLEFLRFVSPKLPNYREGVLWGLVSAFSVTKAALRPSSGMSSASRIG
jgi:hypothetical protein